MSELLDCLRGWRNTRDAAAWLSDARGKTVTEADLLLLGLKGHLTLSVNFEREVVGELGRAVAKTDIPTWEHLEEIDDFDLEVPQKYVFLPSDPEEIVTVHGVWDLPLVGTERLEVEYRYHTLTGGPAHRISTDHLYLTRPGGIWCRLSIDYNDELPDDASLGVRNAALEELEQRMPVPPSQGAAKPSGVDVTVGAESTNSSDSSVSSSRPAEELSPPDVVTDGAVQSGGLIGEPSENVIFDLGKQDLDTSQGRRKAIDAFIEACEPVVIMRRHIWQAIGHTTARGFETWQATDGKATAEFDRNIRRVLAMPIPEFLAQLRRQDLLDDE